MCVVNCTTGTAASEASASTTTAPRPANTLEKARREAEDKYIVHVFDPSQEGFPHIRSIPLKTPASTYATNNPVQIFPIIIFFSVALCIDFSGLCLHTSAGARVLHRPSEITTPANFTFTPVPQVRALYLPISASRRLFVCVYIYIYNNHTAHSSFHI